MENTDAPLSDNDSLDSSSLSSSIYSGSGGNVIHTFLQNIHDDDNLVSPAESHHNLMPSSNNLHHSDTKPAINLTRLDHHSSADHKTHPHDKGQGSTTVTNDVYKNTMSNPLQVTASTGNLGMKIPRQYNALQTGRGGLKGWTRASSALAESEIPSSPGWPSGALTGSMGAAAQMADGNAGEYKMGRRQFSRWRTTSACTSKACDKEQPHARQWNVSTMPMWKMPSNSTNRLFNGLAESKPGREPKDLEEVVEQLSSSPPLTLRMPVKTLDFNRPQQRKKRPQWNTSTLLYSLASKDDVSVNNYVNGSYGTSPFKTDKASRAWSHGGYAEAASKKGCSSRGQRARAWRTPTTRPSKPRSFLKWNFSTLPQWKPTFKYNQYDNITESRGLPSTPYDQYDGAKSRYMSPSNKYLRLKKETELEIQRREEFRLLDIIYSTKVPVKELKGVMVSNIQPPVSDITQPGIQESSKTQQFKCTPRSGLHSIIQP